MDVHCEKCNENCHKKTSVKVTRMGDAIIMKLERIVHDPTCKETNNLAEITATVQIEQEIQASWVSPIAFPKGQDRTLQLMATVAHRTGHFVVTYRKNNNWYLADDATTTKINLKKVVKEDNFLLMYQMKPKESKTKGTNPLEKETTQDKEETH